MNICSKGHEEICYTLDHCPLCWSISELAHARFEHKRQTNALEDRIDHLVDKLREYENEPLIPAMKGALKRNERAES